MRYAPRHARRDRRGLLSAAVTLSTAGIAVLALANAPSASAAGPAVSAFYLDRETSAYAKDFLGDLYAWGGTSPAGFDCSGLAQYVYAAFGYQIPRTAQQQSEFFRQIPEADAWGGDLVFFHDFGGYVYHVGIYEGGGHMVSALDPSYGVAWTPVSWGGGYATFGTITH